MKVTYVVRITIANIASGYVLSCQIFQDLDFKTAIVDNSIKEESLNMPNQPPL